MLNRIGLLIALDFVVVLRKKLPAPVNFYLHHHRYEMTKLSSVFIIECKYFLEYNL